MSFFAALLFFAWQKTEKASLFGRKSGRKGFAYGREKRHKFYWKSLSFGRKIVQKAKAWAGRREDI